MTFLRWLVHVMWSPVIRRTSSPSTDRRARPATAHQWMLAVALSPELLPGFSPLHLLAQRGRDFEPDSFQCVVACFSVDVRSGHGQMDVRAESGRVFPLAFQHHISGGHRDEFVQPGELLLQPCA
jgi:hypothetical protein